jgi:hypothetical protein
MSQCPKCAGPTRERFDKAIGAYTFCDHCGPKFTPPYTPERIALATGNRPASEDPQFDLLEMDMARKNKSARVPAGDVPPCPRCEQTTKAWTHADDWKPAPGKGHLQRWFKCENPKCKTTQIPDWTSFEPAEEQS